MDDYDNLVKNLRYCADATTCKYCFWRSESRLTNMLRIAANAIEELQGKAKVLEKIADKWCDAVPKWIPVTERMPQDGEFVLVCNDDGHMMIAKHETETYEWYYKYTNYDFDIWDNEEQGPVCYWMPLPEQPKEGE